MITYREEMEGKYSHMITYREEIEGEIFTYDNLQRRDGGGNIHI